MASRGFPRRYNTTIPVPESIKTTPTIDEIKSRTNLGIDRSPVGIPYQEEIGGADKKSFNITPYATADALNLVNFGLNSYAIGDKRLMPQEPVQQGYTYVPYTRNRTGMLANRRAYRAAVKGITASNFANSNAAKANLLAKYLDANNEYEANETQLQQNYNARERGVRMAVDANNIERTNRYNDNLSSYYAWKAGQGINARNAAIEGYMGNQTGRRLESLERERIKLLSKTDAGRGVFRRNIEPLLRDYYGGDYLD